MLAPEKKTGEKIPRQAFFCSLSRFRNDFFFFLFSRGHVSLLFSLFFFSRMSQGERSHTDAQPIRPDKAMPECNIVTMARSSDAGIYMSPSRREAEAEVVEENAAPSTFNLVVRRKSTH